MFKYFEGTLNLKDTQWGSLHNTSDMFYDTQITTLDLSSLDVSGVTDMSGMFYHCTNLTSLNLSGWNTSQVTDMRSMFDDCKALPVIDISDFDTSRVEHMDYMFANYSEGDNMLEHIYVGDGWTTSALLNGGEYNCMFNYCIQLPNYDGEHTDASKAYVGEGGYLEMKP